MDELLVDGDDVFIRVSVCSVCECSEDIQPGFGFCVDCVGAVL